ncbi:DUF3971 domain-containing protein [Rhodomicrobium sp. Az07]|uniref:DUF3971 domain-containing protein n=1 Tax=Rhodomicrobium sp. Az07 TaxID=2839034 RepID=UPI001BEC716E|nr:DUF3971 domain-containing protein [Rhodomicrobium sp. Az07]MBT3070689.1 DUF3971 domain-containing protein [Rhodomicrobium sp. Az07]
MAIPFKAQVQLSRLSKGGKVLADAIPGSVKTASRHSFRVGWRLSAVFALMFSLAVGALYAKLLTGPISFAFLVPAVQDRLNAQLDGYSLRVGDAILRLSSSWGLEFRLADVSVVDENNQEIAKAPLASVDLSETSLLKLALAPSQIKLLGPKILIFNLPGRGLTLTPETTPASGQGWGASQAGLGDGWQTSEIAPQSPEVAGVHQLARQGLHLAEPRPFALDPEPILRRLFAAIGKRGASSQALKSIGLQDAIVYFANENSVSTWRVADFQLNLNERGSKSIVDGKLALERNGAVWHASFTAENRPNEKRYKVTASVRDVVPKTIWDSWPSLDALKLIELPVSGDAHFDIGYDGGLTGGEAEIRLGAGRFFAPFDQKHPAIIDGGTLRVSYDKASEAVIVRPMEMRWDESLLTVSGRIARETDPGTGKALWRADFDGRGTRLSAPQYAVAPVALDVFKIEAAYDEATDSVALNRFELGSGASRLAFSGRASRVRSGGPISLVGDISPMPFSFLKAIWPVFMANGAREWAGTNLPVAQVTGGTVAVNLSADEIAALDDGGDVPESGVSMRMGLSGAKIYHIKGLPPIETRDTQLRVKGRRFIYDIPGEARIEVPSGKVVTFTDGQLLIDDLRPEFPDADIRFKGGGEVAAVLELLDQPPLGYVKAVGFKPSLVNGQMQASFDVKFPLLMDLKFEQMSITGKSRVSDIRSGAIPGGVAVNGGAVNFDISEKAIGANGEIRVNGVPVTLVWQRIFDAPPEKQPTLRLASILNEKARHELGLNVNHMVKGDLPVALAIAMQRDGPPKIMMEANLTNADLFLTAIGWRKPPGQKATVACDVIRRNDNSMLFDNFTMTGDGIAINGRAVMNDKHRLSSFSFPDFSTNALTHLSIAGELTPQNILKVQAKGASFDGRQFFKALLSAGKIADKEPPPLKDEPGLDLNVEIETVFGYYDTNVKSVIVDARRRGGKFTYIEAAGRLNGESPVAVHVDQRTRDARILSSDATDAGSAFRLVGFYGAMRGGTMSLRMSLDGGGGADKSGTLEVRRFAVVGDQVVGRVVSQAAKEGARYRPDAKQPQQVYAGDVFQFDRMVVPFSIAQSQFQLHDAAINGPVIGATMRGRIDFSREILALSGTYVPLYGFNAVLGVVPVLGDLLKGRENEGVFGITFAVQGRTSNPDVIVNPVSMLAPGFLRQIFEFENAPAQPVQPQPQTPQAQTQQRTPAKVR